MEYVRQVIVGVVTGLVAYLNPLDGEIFALAMVFVMNFGCGLLADLLVNDGQFKFSKAWRCIVEMTVFFVLIAAIYTYGEKKGQPDGALQCVSFVTYTVTYFYATNMLRNLKMLFRNSKNAYHVFSFLYYVLSIEFIKRVPSLGEYLGIKMRTNDKE